jgi:catechol 2,3-dioxygenase-like lactoylglutathione lyase family enzyme
MINTFTPIATIPTTDTGRAQKFYEETLGLQIEREDEQGAFYKCGDGRLFVYRSQYAGTNKATAVTFGTEDVAKFDAAVDSLRKKGVKFMTFEYEGMTWDKDVAVMGDNMKAIWFADPDGNILNVACGLM